MFRKGLITCAIAGLLTSGIAFAKLHVYVGIAPPAPIVETPAPAPGPGYIYTPGYYNWNGSSYVWVNGGWVLPPAHRHHYVAGIWVHNHRGYYFREGHWR
jgi:WXXGXW repeat (2 copies)